MKKDIEVLEQLASRTYKIDKDGWETAVCSIDEQLAIRNIIARNKELEKLSENIKMFRDNNLSSEIDYVIALKSNFMEYLKTDYIPKSKVRDFLGKSKIVTSENKEKTYLLIDVTEIKKELLQEGDK